MLVPAICTLFVLCGGNVFGQGSNDHIFPGAAVAKPTIDFDPRGFIIHGKREFLVSAGLEYARMPRALWEDRLLRLKRAGFNCVEIYTFWNWHEPKEGQFDFSGDHDLDAFLKLAAKMGLYVIARVGPYYCAEWDNGGYPLWLRFKEGVEVRKDNGPFLKYVDRFFDKLMPIVAANQINRGGSVILVQLENEHNEAWGTFMPNGYFTHMREKALALGIEVPYFFSGLHHASDPAGDVLNFDDIKRPNPWFSTEFWSVWYNGYSSTEKDALTYERRTWKIIAHGGGGYNYYMAYGGTNFGYTNNDEDAASYDYGAAVGQAGDLRPIYYSFKRMAWFARSFQAILCNAVDRPMGKATDSVRVTARHSPAGDIEFFDNYGASGRKVHLINGADAVDVSLAAGEILPVVHDHGLSPGIRLVWAPVRIFGIWGAPARKTMIVYGAAGEHGKIVFAVDGKRQKLDVEFGMGDVPKTYTIKAGSATVRVMAMTQQQADRSWYIAETGKLSFGAGYAGEVDTRTGAIDREEPMKGADVAVALSNWTMHAVSDMAKPGYSTLGWATGPWPLQMGADGDLSPNAWYRTEVTVDSSGDYVLQVEGGDRGTVFVDGKLAARVNLHDGEIPLQLAAGKHLLALFTAHDGRDKLAGFMGDMSAVDMKGVTGHPRLERGVPSSHELGGWKYLKAAGVHDVDAGAPAVAGDGVAGWADYKIGDDVFSQKEGFGWFRTMLPAPPSGAKRGVIKFRSVDENATVFVNGRKLIHHEGWNIPFQVTLDGLDTVHGPLVLTIFIENYSNEGGIDRPVRVNYFKDSKDITGWAMRGGISEPGEIDNWSTLHAAEGWPTYFRTSFTVPAYGRTGEHPIWRVHTDSLGHGSVWVNGHNLGRYPEKVPAPGLFIPECWLKAGENELVVYDEDGKAPTQVRVLRETAASRVITNNTGK